MLNQTAVDLPLRDIHLPEPIHWWPLAYGWWVIIIFFLCILVLGGFAIYKWLKPNLRKEALQVLNEIESQFQQTNDALNCITDVSAFLRRVTLSQNPSPHLAGITGRAWLKYLDKTLDRPEFSEGIGQILLTGPYSKKLDSQAISQLLLLCRKWIKTL